MDLIYMNSKKEDVGVFQNYTLDLAYGIDENDFELTTDTNNNVCEPGNIIYIEGTEYGGVIRKVRVVTDTNTLVYGGDTWHGILAKKVLEPDSGADYLVCSGEANTVIASLIARMGLQSFFKASTENSGLTIGSYKMNRYINAYEGIRKMLAKVGGKLKFNFSDGFVILSAEPLVDYSQDDEFDSSQIDFSIEKNYHPTNHCICLGKGDLKERTVIHLYADANGNISKSQTQFGIDEVTDVYENANTESVEELEQGGIDMLQNAWNTDTLEVNFDATRNYDIGDIVGARENVTGIFMAKDIIKKIVTINNDLETVSYKVGD